MATEENIDALVDSSAAASTQNKRQRFYIELKPGETTIVSWKKLLREGKPLDQCPSTSTTGTVKEFSSDETHCSSTHETSERALDNCEVGRCNDYFVRIERLDHHKSSGCQQLRKCSVEMTEVPDKKNDDPSIKHVRLEETSPRGSAKISRLLDQPFTQSSIPPVVKEHYLSLRQSLEAHAPPVVYEKKLATFSSKPNYASPVNEMETAFTFPLKSKQCGLQKSEKFSSGRSRMKGGILGDPSVVMWQKSENCVPLQTKPRFRKLMNGNGFEVSFKKQHSVKGDRRGALLDVDLPGYNHSLQQSMSTEYASVSVNGAKPAKPFNEVLERAIGELERAVAGSKSFKIEASDAHTSLLTIERELPLEVNVKLGEVAILTQSRKEGILEELVSRLVSIIGKLVHGKTLKRLLRKFVMLKLSVKKEKAEKFKAIKNEIIAMVSRQQGGAANCREAKAGASLAETYKLDGVIEDKLCDLYDLYVQGPFGDKGVETWKLFMELGDLWAKGVMNRKFTDAIIRAKSRRMPAERDQDQKLLTSDSEVSPMAMDCTRTSHLLPSRKRKVTLGDSSHLTSPPSGWTFPMKVTLNHPAVPPNISHPLLKYAQQRNPTEKKLNSSVVHSPVVVEQQKQQVHMSK